MVECKLPKLPHMNLLTSHVNSLSVLVCVTVSLTAIWWHCLAG